MCKTPTIKDTDPSSVVPDGPAALMATTPDTSKRGNGAALAQHAQKHRVTTVDEVKWEKRMRMREFALIYVTYMIFLACRKNCASARPAAFPLLPACVVVAALHIGSAA